MNRVLSRCIRHNPDHPTTRCQGIIYADGKAEHLCSKECRFERRKAGEGYPPLPDQEKQRLVAALYEMMRLAGFGKLEDSIDEIYRWFEEETGYTRPIKDDPNFTRSTRQKVLDAWMDKKFAKAQEALDDYLPDEHELTPPLEIVPSKESA